MSTDALQALGQGSCPSTEYADELLVDGTFPPSLKVGGENDFMIDLQILRVTLF